jgi:hypothetical protein
MPFEITPADGSGQPEVAPNDMPQYIQFQFNGVDLGGPDATTLNFAGANVLATRSGDVVTVTMA